MSSTTRRGRFITFEGLDGSGKSTQLRRLAESLTALGHTVTVTRNPGGTPLGDRLRNVLVDSRSEAAIGPITPQAEMAMMFADRAQNLAQVVLPAIEQGHIVLCDRYTDSSEAYQGAGRELGPARVLELHHAVCNDIWPELTILLLPPLEDSLARARRRNERNVRRTGSDESRFEREGDAFYTRVHHQYEAIAARDPQRVFTVGAGSIEEIASTILAEVERRLA